LTIFEEKKFIFSHAAILDGTCCRMYSYTKTWIMTDFFVLKKITTGGNLKWPIKFICNTVWIYLNAASLLMKRNMSSYEKLILESSYLSAINIKTLAKHAQKTLRISFILVASWSFIYDVFSTQHR
jgi:hypothetical protein